MSRTGTGMPWLIGDSYGVGMFTTSDSFTHSRGGEVTLMSLGDRDRLQGIASQQVSASFDIVQSVAYTITVTLDPSLLHVQGDASAELDYSYSIGWFGGGDLNAAGGDRLDLVAGADPYSFTSSGVIELDGGSRRFIDVSVSSALNAVINEPGEQIDVRYAMSVRIDFTPVPAPGGIALAGVCGLLGAHRRRRR